MSQTKKSLQDLTLLDRFLFAEVMEDAETFQNVLSIIFGHFCTLSPHLLLVDFFTSGFIAY